LNSLSYIYKIASLPLFNENIKLSQYSQYSIEGFSYSPYTINF